MNNKIDDSLSRSEILIIGGGWYGCVMAHQLKLKYPEARVVIFEKNFELFTGTSGRFGYRAHRGIHYPRSFLTRFFIYNAMSLFSQYYSELMNNDRSIYALANTEKVSKEEFIGVSLENLNTQGFEPKEGIVDIAGREYSNISYLVEYDEPSLVMGERLRKWFKSKLKDIGVEIYCNFTVKSIEKHEGRLQVETIQEESFFFNHVINATGFQDLLSKNLISGQGNDLNESSIPQNIESSQSKSSFGKHTLSSLFFGTEISYQACLAFVYNYCSSTKLMPPKSIMFMDGNLPSLTRYDTRLDENEPFLSYVLTHVTHSVVGSYPNPEQAKEQLARVDSDFINDRRQKAETEIQKYYPAFGEEFEYVTYESTVFVRTVTPEAFRGAFVVRDPKDVIVTFPGKISQTLLLIEEVKLLIENDLTKLDVMDGFSFVKGGTLDLSYKYGVFDLPDSYATKENSYKFLLALKESPLKCFDPIRQNFDKFLAALYESPQIFFSFLREMHYKLVENQSKNSEMSDSDSIKKKTILPNILENSSSSHESTSASSTRRNSLCNIPKNSVDFFKRSTSSSSANIENSKFPNLYKLDFGG